MKIHNFTSSKRIIRSLQQQLSLEGENLDHIKDWISEILNEIGVRNCYVESVAFQKVENFIAELPPHCHSVIQIAKDMHWQDKGTCLCPKEVSEVLEEEEKLTIPVPIDCNGSPIAPYDVAYYRPLFAYQLPFGQWGSSALYGRRFKRMRAATSSFASSILCEEINSELYSYCDDEFIFVDNIIKCSFPEGAIAVSYLAYKLDDEGYPMIPDHEYYTQAAKFYCLYNIMAKDFWNGKQGSEQRMIFAKQEWEKYRDKAEALEIHYTEEELENFKNEWLYILPNDRKADGFYGNAGREENRKYLNVGNVTRYK